jgi:hypothetical protein
MSYGELTSTPVTRFLDECAIPYRFYKHPGAVYSLEQAARERGSALSRSSAVSCSAFHVVVL